MADVAVLSDDFVKERIVSTTVDGLRVYVLAKPGFRRKYAEMFVHYGSNDNAFVSPDGRQVEVPPGIAHFLEHKMFEKEWGEAFSEFSKLGASGNAYTSNNYTSYLFWTLDTWKESLEILFDVALTPHFTSESVAREQGIIGQEIRMYNDDPGSRLVRETMQSLYLRHPVRIDIAGTEESIATINKDLLYLCHETFYRPANMALYLAGDLDPKEVFQAAGEYIRRYARKGPGKVVDRKRPAETAEVGKDAEVSLPVPVPMVQIAWKDEPAKDTAALVRGELGASILMDILFGRSSEFFSKVYEEGLVDEISSSYESWPDYAYASVAAQTTRPEELAARVQEEVERVRKTGVIEEDFERAKRASEGRFYTLFDSFDTVGEMHVHLQDIGTDVFSYGRALRALTLEDVNRKFDALLPERSVRTIVRDKAGPKANSER
ncbi:MAG: EF-P 5-aminopentanol modification-associated protein YfmH [Bacillota bacterium]